MGGCTSEGKPEEVREVEQSLFFLTSYMYVAMFLYHTTYRRAGVHVYTSQRVSPEVLSKEVLHFSQRSKASCLHLTDHMKGK